MLGQALLNLAHQLVSGDAQRRHASHRVPRRRSAPRGRGRRRHGGRHPARSTCSRIFDLYFTTKKEGSGIGLSMVYRIVQLHDGEVEVQSTPRTRDTIPADVSAGLIGLRRLQCENRHEEFGCRSVRCGDGGGTGRVRNHSGPGASRAHAGPRGAPGAAAGHRAAAPASGAAARAGRRSAAGAAAHDGQTEAAAARYDPEAGPETAGSDRPSSSRPSRPPIRRPPPCLRSARRGQPIACRPSVRFATSSAARTVCWGKSNYQRLTAERQKAYNQAKQFIEGAEGAIRDAKFEYALELAEKAETLAKELQS